MIDKIPILVIGVGLPRSGISSLGRLLCHSPLMENNRAKKGNILSPAGDTLTSANKRVRFYLDFSVGHDLNDEMLKEIAVLGHHKKILLCLRHPVERAFSQYIYWISNYFGRGLTPPDMINVNFKETDPSKGQYNFGYSFFDDKILAQPSVNRSYAGWIRQCHERFGDNNVKVLILEEWQNNPAFLLQELNSFLGVDLQVDPSKLNSGRRSTMPFYVLFHPRNYVRQSFIINNIDQLRSEIEHSFIRLGFVSGGSLEVLPTMPTDMIDLALQHSALWTDNLPADYAEAIHHRFFEQDLEVIEDILDRDLSIWRQFRSVTYKRQMPPLAEGTDGRFSINPLAIWQH